jgi:hypothetical protein
MTKETKMWNKIVIFFEIVYSILTLGKKEIKPKVVYVLFLNARDYNKWFKHITTLPRGTYFKYIPNTDARECIFNANSSIHQKTHIIYANADDVISFQQHLKSVFPVLNTIIAVETISKHILLTCINELSYSDYQNLVHVKESFYGKKPNNLLTLIKASEDHSEISLENNVSIWKSWNPI